MHKSIAKQLNLDERQTQQLEREMEAQSWLFSSSIIKRSLAVYGHAMLGYLILFGPLLFLALSVSILLR